MVHFGSWLVTKASIEWKGAGIAKFVIPAEDLLTQRAGPADLPVYEWILVATAEEWLTQNDLFDLNYAFVFAAALQNGKFDYEVFDNTMAEQYEIFEEEDEQDEGFTSN